MTTLPLEGTRTRRPSAAAAPRSRASRTTVLVAWDVLLALVLFVIAMPVAGSPVFSESVRADAIGIISLPVLVFTALIPFGIAIVGGYDTRRNIYGVGRITRFIGVAAACAWITLTVAGVSGMEIDMGQMAAVTLTAPLAWIAGRRILEAGVRRNPDRVLIVGSGQVARHIADLAVRHPERGLSVVGCVDDQMVSSDGINPPLLGGISDLRGVLHDHRISRVVVSFSINSDTEILRVLRECDSHGVDVAVVPRLFDLVGPDATIESLGGMGLISVPRKSRGIVQRAAKRAIDIAVSATLLLITAPIMAAVAVAIRLDDGDPILFRQVRIGRNGRQFEILKFRTMVQGADKQQASELIESGPDAIAAVSDAMKRQSEAWITTTGAFLRKSSLDELPQLWNVLRGDMSLVGPRPLRQYEVDALNDWEITRQEVRPGITGLWQILGRSDIQWDERMQLDYSYVRHWTFRKDLIILARTAAVVFGRRGAV